MAKFCIYSLTCRHTGDVYVGRTSKLKRRLIDHASEARRGVQLLVYQQIREHGFDSFDVSVLQRVDSKAEAVTAEREWVVKLAPKLNTCLRPGSDRSMFGSGKRNRKGQPLTPAEAEANRHARECAVAAIKGQKQAPEHVQKRMAAYDRRREAGLPLGRPAKVNPNTVHGLRKLGLSTEDIALVAGCSPSRVNQINPAPARGAATR